VQESVEARLIKELRETANRIINEEIETTMRRLTVKCFKETGLGGDKLIVQFSMEEPKGGNSR
jgi:hypothetical protein